VSSAEESVGTLEEALRHATRLLESEPALAAEQAREILAVAPGHPPAQLLLASAQRRAGDTAAALEVLDPLVRAQPRWAAAHYEQALCFGGIGRGDAAIAALRRVVSLKPDHPEAWRVLGDHLMASGETEGADAAYARHIKCSTRDPRLLEAATAMLANDIPRAEALLKTHLRQVPTDVPAIRMLAEVAVRVGRNADAERLLQRCLELAPGFVAARYNYAVLLHRQNQSGRALPEVERLLVAEPRNPGYRNLLAVILGRVGEYARASALYRELLDEYPANPKVWMSYGHLLKTEGRREECIQAYREAIAREPSLGEAFWSLANMKTFRFGAEDIAAMHAQLAREELSAPDRLHFHFALGKAMEDAGECGESFRHYERGNVLHHAANPWDPEQNTARIERYIRDFTPGFFATRADRGCHSTAPIFIVGMPRSGSTLVEQMLSSHSLVEGTTELPDIISMARELRDRGGGDDTIGYNEVLAALGAEELRALGEDYLERTRIHRKTDAPFFIDKMPNNFLHTGLIHLMLPRARIIDARRHPMACCFSNFKQHYARGQNFSYRLIDMGRYYADYVRLMAHYDTVLPGRVHRVIYERMVADTEAEVRRLLAYCGLPFEAGCLRFYENDRPVRTASSEQVRRPIYSEGVDQWRQYEPWLGPLREALGPVLETYPDPPPRGSVRESAAPRHDPDRGRE
jgi:predicted Zn-dependent protease